MIVFFPHSATSNHGCEAILLSIADLINGKKSELNQLCLIHRDIENDDYQTLIPFYTIIPFPKYKIKRGSLKWIKNNINAFIHRAKEINQYMEFKRVISKYTTAEAFISIGGDNYCYGTPYFMYAVDKYAIDSNSKLILWGCSIENKCDRKMLKDLSRFNLIIARETLTYKYLKSKLNNRIVCYPDPAFTLRPEVDMRFDLPQNTVGINISPMILSYETNSGKALMNYERLLNYIFTETDYSVALIPHVTVGENDDRIPLKMLYDRFLKYHERIKVVNDGNCRRLKYAISKCRFFVGARTHASIAAYSSIVPTLVVGYSIKSRGIAVDLFGTEDHYVIPVQAMKDDCMLMNGFKWIVENEEQIKTKLKEKIPEYIQQAAVSAEEVLKEIKGVKNEK